MRRGDGRLYRQLRRDMLRSAQHHRQRVGREGMLGELHARELAVCQRQLGALRQAYRRTCEAVAWESYKQAVERE